MSAAMVVFFLAWLALTVLFLVIVRSYEQQVDEARTDAALAKAEQIALRFERDEARGDVPPFVSDAAAVRKWAQQAGAWGAVRRAA